MTIGDTTNEGYNIYHTRNIEHSIWILEMVYNVIIYSFNIKFYTILENVNK